MNESPAPGIAVGSRVFSLDGESLGRVKELRGGLFKVDAPLAPDYWLRDDCIERIDGEGVVLAVEKDNLGDIKVDEPEADGEASDSAPELHEPRPDEVREGLLTGTVPPFAPVGFTSWEGIRPEYRQIWEERHGASDRSWEHDEAGFRYGYEVACDPAHQAMSWDEAEPYIRAAYPDWRAESGYNASSAGWEDVRDNVREAFERTTQRHRSEV